MGAKGRGGFGRKRWNDKESCWQCIKSTATIAFHQKDPIQTDGPYCFDMNPVGKPDAGNLQVRFDEALTGNMTKLKAESANQPPTLRYSTFITRALLIRMVSRRVVA